MNRTSRNVVVILASALIGTAALICFIVFLLKGDNSTAISEETTPESESIVEVISEEDSMAQAEVVGAAGETEKETESVSFEESQTWSLCMEYLQDHPYTSEGIKHMLQENGYDNEKLRSEFEQFENCYRDRLKDEARNSLAGGQTLESLLGNLTTRGIPREMAEYAINEAKKELNKGNIDLAIALLNSGALSEKQYFERMQMQGISLEDAQAVEEQLSIDWNTQAVMRIHERFDVLREADSEMVEAVTKQLTEDGFTEEEINYSLSYLNLKQ